MESSAAVKALPEKAPIYQVVSNARVHESALNTRRRYDEKKIKELAQSIRENGIIEPLVVRPLAGKPGDFEIVAGSRRKRAAVLAELDELPIVIRHITDLQVREIIAVENKQRDDFDALAEAENYSEMIKGGYSIKVIADKIGLSPNYVYDRLKLLELVPTAQKLLLADRITAGHAILIARLSPKDQERTIDPQGGGLFEGEDTLLGPNGEDLLGTDKLPKWEQEYSDYKAVSVRELERWIAEHVRLEPTAPIVADLFPETAAAVEDAFAKSPKRPKILKITHESYVQPEAKEGLEGRIYTGRTWKLADGTKGHPQCDKSGLGVLVLGAHRGEKLVVCVNKECKPHWGKERAEYRRMRASWGTPAPAPAPKKETEAAKDKRLAEESKQKAEAERRRLKAEAWYKARPKVLEAVARGIKTAKFDALKPILKNFLANWYELTSDEFKKAIKNLGYPTTVDDLGRAAFFAMLIPDIDNAETDEEIEEAAKRAKALGVDVPAILAEFMPKEKPQTSGKGAAAVDSKKTTKAPKKKKK